jgi:hypothetical protein
MTSEQTDREQGEQQHQALMAVTRALTDNEMAAILARSNGWPGMDGAGVADVLEHTVSYDEFLDRTEPFYEALPADFPGGPGVIYVLHSLILLGVPLTTATVRALLVRAGLVKAEIVPAYDPFGDLAKIIYEVRRMPGPFTADLADAIARLKQVGAWGTPYVIEARLRSLVAGGQ